MLHVRRLTPDFSRCCFSHRSILAIVALYQAPRTNTGSGQMFHIPTLSLSVSDLQLFSWRAIRMILDFGNFCCRMRLVPVWAGPCLYAT
jgi:hypothetical protein